MNQRIRRFGFILSWVFLAGFCLAESLWAVTPQIEAGGSHTVALKSDGTLWAWGDNSQGQLGDGTTTERHAPVQIPLRNSAASVCNFDGDMKTDIAVWRPGDGIWYIMRSSDQVVTTQAWGAGYAPYNDEPISQK